MNTLPLLPLRFLLSIQEMTGCQPGQCPCPWLLYSDVNCEETFCNYSPFPPHKENESCIKSLPELRGKNIHGCCHGWLILQDVRHREIVSLWNPVTLQILPLPPLDPCKTGDADGVVSAVMTCPPDDANSENCLLLLIFRTGEISCWPRRVNPSWSAQSAQRLYMDRLIALNGVIYGWVYYIGDEYIKSFVSLEVVDDDNSNPLKLSSLRLKKPVSRFPCFQTLKHMVESCGLIYLVYLHYKEWEPKAVEVWELDLQGMNWVEVKTLDGRAFFLGNNCTWCWGSKNPESGRGVEENCVYFVLLNCEALYSYNLQDCSFYANFLTPSYYFCWWVMPQHQSLLTRGEWKQGNQKVDVIDQEGFSTIECKELLQPIKKKKKYKELPQHNSSQENLFCELPVHIMELIPKYLHLFDYWNFRKCCKTFHSATPVAEWRSNNMFPLLMFSKNADGECQVMDPFRDDSHSFILGLYRDLQSIDFSKDGWLLVRCFGKPLQFFNAFTRVRGDFPPNEFTNAFKSIGFSTNPTSPGCLSVGICDGDSYMTVHYIQHGDEAWNSCIIEDNDLYGFQSSTFSPVYHDGAFYFVGACGILMEFELIGGKPSWHSYDKPSDYPYPYHLIECDGELLAVEIGHMGKWVKVFRFNLSKKNWVRVKSLGNRILFVCPWSSSFSVVTSERGMGNKIFFSRLKGNDIIFYSLDTCKYHVLGNEEDSLEDFYGTREPRHPCWV